MPANKQLYRVFTLIVAWFALITQWCLTTFGLVDFLSFFTVQSNLMVALCLTFSLFIPRSALGTFFSKSRVQSAIALYIFIVGLVYNTLLRGLADFKGMQLIIDNLLHVAVPVLFVLYWFIFTPQTFFPWKQSLYWLIYPFLYTVYSMIRGAIVHWYPYPFLNVDNLGYARVFINMLGVLAAFSIVSLVIVAGNRSTQKDPIKK